MRSSETEYPAILAANIAEAVLLLVPLMLIGGAIWLFLARRTVAKQRRIEAARANVDAARRFLAQVMTQGGLREVRSSLMLKNGERAFHAEEVALYETRSIRNSTGGSVRVAGGLRIGGGTGESHQAWRKLDVGTVTVTNDRLVFDGSHTNRAFKLEKLLSVNPGTDFVEISVDGRQKSLVLAVRNGLILATVIHLCRGAKDPALITESVDITYALDEA